MSSTKKVTISLTPVQQEKARSLSKDLNPDFCSYYEDVWSYAIFAVIEPKENNEEN